jgi:hypothetical protein
MGHLGEGASKAGGVDGLDIAGEFEAEGLAEFKGGEKELLGGGGQAQTLAAGMSFGIDGEAAGFSA